MAAEKEYKKLPGRGTRFEGARLIAGTRRACRLWLGNDHVLMILSSYFTEEFKRFYFRDIQAITIRKTNSARNLSILLVIIATPFGVGAIFASDPGGIKFLIGTFVLFAGLAIVNLLLGPGCVVEIKTAVQTEELSSLKRLRVARKTIGILRPLIEQAQGTMSFEELQLAAGTALEKAGVQAGGILLSDSINSCSGRVHQWLFLVFVIFGLLKTLTIFFHPVVMFVVEMFLTFVLLALAVTSLIKQHGTDLTEGVRRLTWIGTSYLVLCYFISIGTNAAIGATNPSASQTQLSIFEYLAALNPLETPWFLGLLIFSSGCSLILGTIGAILTNRFREQKRKTSVPPLPNPSVGAAS